ncbi:putative transcription factor sre2 [Paramyrothecium foliicola]|nr:putative transcription factor sre2 [Paramyrothecium foliicola]
MDHDPSNPTSAANQSMAKGKRGFEASDPNSQFSVPLSFAPSARNFEGAETEPTTGPSGASLTSFDLPTTAPTDVSFTQAPAISPCMREKQAAPRTVPGRSIRRKDKHDNKRVKSDFESDTPALDSIDYWIQFDDDDVDKWGSFEIDFSKRNDPFQTSSGGKVDSTPGLGAGLYTSAPGLFTEEDLIEDNALDNALSEDEDNVDSMNLEDQLSKIDFPPPPEVPPREGLYSTPLSWEKPQSGLPFDLSSGALPQLQNDPLGFPLAPPASQTLSPDEQRRLIAIAMNVGRTPASFMPATGFGLGFGAGLGFGQLGDDGDAALDLMTWNNGNNDGSGDGSETVGADAGSKGKEPAKRPQTQRTNTTTTDKSKDKLKSADRIAHNDIERKYRTNLKDKIAELRDAVPALRTPEEGSTEGSGAQGQSKPSKGTVLTKATEYIQQLERRNKAIMKEQQHLARRLQAFETLLSAAATQSFMMPHSGALFDPRGFC